jgi:hypothetical protein
LRTFGLYLSSLVLMSLSADRYCAVLHPLKVVNAYKRVRVMLVFSWIVAGFLSIPQVSQVMVMRKLDFVEQLDAWFCCPLMKVMKFNPLIIQYNRSHGLC